VELFHADMMKQTATLCNFANTPKNVLNIKYMFHSPLSLCIQHYQKSIYPLSCYNYLI
jgi:hypothetical protein